MDRVKYVCLVSTNQLLHNINNHFTIQATLTSLLNALDHKQRITLISFYRVYYKLQLTYTTMLINTLKVLENILYDILQITTLYYISKIKLKSAVYLS